MKKLILTIALLTGFTGLNAGIFTSQAEKEEAQINRELAEILLSGEKLAAQINHKLLKLELRELKIERKIKEISDLIKHRIKPCEPKASAETHFNFRIDDCLKLRDEQCDTCLEKVKKMVENDIEKTSFWHWSNCPQQVNRQSLREFDEWFKNQPKQ